MSTSTKASNVSKSVLNSLRHELKHSRRNVANVSSGETVSPLSLYVDQVARGLESEDSANAESRRRLKQLRELELILRSSRVHAELLQRYNPTHGMSEAERIRTSARVVGWEVPLEYVDEDGSLAKAVAGLDSADEGQVQESRRKVEELKAKHEAKGYTGPLPFPPESG
ncbi:hypothetical protein A1Q1_04190 [Ceraceosorus bombacis]|uniref:Uncharacterized protein n=1 Tax=Ceraceosorus bombacis TaxID=401625 RepID=A0A0P1BLJ8_9BASI|nr:hypothetical protein A1Q1_04190 [Ceraceosorus bombacis]